MSAKIDNFLSRLDKVKKSGKSSWMACCPAHGDKNPSMVVSEGTDGRVLVHCFAQGCSIQDIVASVGLEISDLMPDRVGEYRSGSQTFHPMDVLKAVRTDLERALIALKAAQAGEVPTSEQTLAMAQIIGRLSMAIKLAGGK